MLATALDRATEKIEEAKAHLGGLTASNNYRHVRTCWKGFLYASNRVFTLLEQGAKVSDASKSWFSQHKHLRRSDPLLCYLHHARNAEEHQLASITKFEPAKIELVEHGKAVATLVNVTKQEDKFIGTLNTHDGNKLSAKGVTELRVHPDHPGLVEVVDRGVRYKPPEEHLGVSVPNVHPHTIAKLMIDYLEKMISEARGLSVS